MMKRILLLVGLAVAMSALISCGKKVQVKTPSAPIPQVNKGGRGGGQPATKSPVLPAPTSNVAPFPELEGEWLSQCEDSDFGEGYQSAQETLTVLKNSMVQKYTYFKSTGCKSTTAGDTEVWNAFTSYILAAPGGPSVGASNPIDLTWQDENGSSSTSLDIFRIYTAPGVPDELYFGDESGNYDSDGRLTSLNLDKKFTRVKK